jgi:hypothetical protein
MRWPLFELVRKPLDALAVSTLASDGGRASLQDAPDVSCRDLKCQTLKNSSFQGGRAKKAG